MKFEKTGILKIDVLNSLISGNSKKLNFNKRKPEKRVSIPISFLKKKFLKIETVETTNQVNLFENKPSQFHEKKNALKKILSEEKVSREKRPK